MRTILQQGDTHNAERVVRSYFKGRTGHGHAKQFSLCWKYLFSVGWCFSGWHDTPAPQGNQKQKIKQVRIEVPVLRMLMKITY